MWMIISDTHDNIEKLKKIKRIVKENNVDTIFHCGDYVAPFSLPYLLIDGVKFIGIFGNNDGEILGLSKKSGNIITPGPKNIEHQGKKIFMMHEPYSLEAAEKSNFYDFVFFGHTHEVVTKKTKNTLIINPGEASGCLTGNSTLCILNPENKEYKIIEI
ncbi:MAG: metallophosphoesterase [Thermotogota bacterium]